MSKTNHTANEGSDAILIALEFEITFKKMTKAKRTKFKKALEKELIKARLDELNALKGGKK